MKKQEFQAELQRILARLEEIFEQDKEIIQPVQETPVPISLERLKGYADRFEERRRLHEQLNKLAGEPIED